MALLIAGVATARPVSQQARVWADDVWEAALEGDRAGLEVLLETPAADGIDAAAREAFLSEVAIWQTHESDDAEHAAARRAAATAEMFAAERDGDVLEALRLILEVQTLSESLDAPLANPDIRSLLDRAEKATDAWRAEGKLFYAQQGLLRLRAAFEDTQAKDVWDRLTDAYEDVSNEMRLLRRYRFAEFHRRYVAFQQEQGEEVRPEYSPRLDTRWQEEIRDVDLLTAARAMETAAAEHVESDGYAPLLLEGLDAVRILGSSDILAETFPTLADQDRLAGWNAALDAAEAVLNVPGVHVSLERTLQHVAAANAETIQLPEGVLWREFTDGAMEALDRFSQVIWPYDYEAFQRQMRGKFVGVGVQIRENDLGEIEVVTPLEGKPAFIAGVKADDVIATVDGDSTAGWTIHDAVRQITGEPDTSVLLGIRRPGEEGLIEVPIVRGVIRMPTVQGWKKLGVDDEGREAWNWMLDEEDGVGYIKLTGFDQETRDDLLRAITTMRRGSGLNGLVLDLRYNPGGLLELAGFVSNLFVPHGEIVTGEGRNGEVTFRFGAQSVGCFLGGLPTAVLVNRGSASASEIVAGCLQAHEAAVVIGQRSYGKGSVQTVHPVGPESRVKVTNQYYRLPAVDGQPGRLVHKRPGSPDWGVEPDLRVAMSVDDIEASERLRIRAAAAVSALPPPTLDSDDEEPNPADVGEPDINRLITDGFDPQLELALLIVRAQVLAETGSDELNDLRQMAGGPVEDLRSRAGRR
jgi:carboxyl-terminal processing protease